MRLTACLRQLRFDIAKHFIPNTNVKAYPMDALGHKGDQRFGYSDSFPLLTEEAFTYIRKLTENEDFVKKTRYTTNFSPFVLRDVANYDTFLHDMYHSEEAENYFSEIVGEPLMWESNSWHACHINVQVRLLEILTKMHLG